MASPIGVERDTSEWGMGVAGAQGWGKKSISGGRKAQTSKLSFTDVVVFAWDTVSRSEGSQTLPSSKIIPFSKRQREREKESREQEERKARDRPRRAES